VTDVDFDAQFADLGGLQPPPTLSDRTLRAVARQRASGGWRVRLIAVVGMAAMAALSLVVVAPPEHGASSSLVERGAGGEPGVAVDLRVAVRRADGELSRFAAGERYAAGDTLMFRIDTPSALDVQLHRNGFLVWSGRAPGGAFDVPSGYTLESGEAEAVFTLAGGRQVVRIVVPAVSP
jgi:hypothetical protein